MIWMISDVILGDILCRSQKVPSEVRIHEQSVRVQLRPQCQKVVKAWQAEPKMFVCVMVDLGEVRPAAVLGADGLEAAQVALPGERVVIGSNQDQP
jgi:hypothetical protein